MNTCYLNTSILKLNLQAPDPSYGSGALIVDLEDAVHVNHKARARQALADLDLRSLTDRKVRVGVRINNLMGMDGLRDLSALSERLRKHGDIAFVQLPKVESRFELELCRSALRDAGPMPDLIAIIETPGGIEHLNAIAQASQAMMFGRVDMAAAMYRPNPAYLAYARGAFCVACARHGIAAIDTANFGSARDISDGAAFEADCLQGRAEGFTARAVVHPAQIAVVQRVFAMDDAELAAYRATIAAYDSAETGFSVMDGNIIAPPFVARARKMLQVYGSAVGVAA